MAWRYTIISDLHLGDQSGADDFWQSGSAPALSALLAEVAADPGHHLVLLGDIFEQWQFSLDEILGRYAPWLDPMFALAREGRVTYVLGNHDYEPFNLFLPFGRLLGLIPLAEEFRIPEVGLVAVHGHLQDPHPERLVPLPGQQGVYRVSRRLVYYLKYLERRYPNVDERLAAFGRAAARGWQSARVLWQFLQRLGPWEARSTFLWLEENLLRWQPPSRQPPEPVPDSPAPDPWEQAAAEMLFSPDGGCRTVVMGHTHVPRWVRWGDRTYLNAGSWCYGNRYPCTFVRIEGDPPEPSLWQIGPDGFGGLRAWPWEGIREDRVLGAG